MNLIEVKNVTKRYDGHVALESVSLNVPQGSIYGLLGPNGAGKSTLIRIINHITAPDSGEVLMQGRQSTLKDVRQIGYLPEERGLYKKMKVAEHIIFIGRLKGMSRADAVSETSKWLERFELTQWSNKKIEKLSKGMAQKVQFIATVVHRPQLLIFDEPFSGFDPINTEQLKNEILRLNREGATVLFSTHNMASVEEVCERISLIDKARVVLSGKVEEVRRNHSKQVYDVELLGTAPLAPAPHLYTLESCKAVNNVVHAQIRLLKGVEAREVISHLNDHYNLLCFAERLPKMNDIFIETVARNHSTSASS